VKAKAPVEESGNAKETTQDPGPVREPKKQIMKQNNVILNTALIALTSLLASGCTHSMKITKRPTPPAAVQGPAQPVRVGFTSVGNDLLLRSAIKAVRENSAIAESKENYKPTAEFTPDYVCQLSQESKFKAAGQNFLITFPGFLVFTHAWLGYQYGANITTHSTLLDASSNVVSQLDIDTPYTFRHCSFGRGATTSCVGWLTPGYGAINIIPGVVFATTYDKSATPPFLDQAAPSYAQYVASKVLEQLAQVQAGCINKAPAVAASDAKVLPATAEGLAQRNENGITEPAAR
jgi:hypothetical protein